MHERTGLHSWLAHLCLTPPSDVEPLPDGFSCLGAAAAAFEIKSACKLVVVSDVFCLVAVVAVAVVVVVGVGVVAAVAVVIGGAGAGAGAPGTSVVDVKQGVVKVEICGAVLLSFTCLWRCCNRARIPCIFVVFVVLSVLPVAVVGRIKRKEAFEKLVQGGRTVHPPRDLHKGLSGLTVETFMEFIKAVQGARRRMVRHKMGVSRDVVRSSASESRLKKPQECTGTC